jgi:SAM-dependent methyltransferase
LSGRGTPPLAPARARRVRRTFGAGHLRGRCSRIVEPDPATALGFGRLTRCQPTAGPRSPRLVDERRATRGFWSDIGCGVGGPARYFAQRFGCKVSGIDITAPFNEAANKLTALLDMGDRVVIEQGDGERLPYDDDSFDGAYAQHVT